MRVGVSPRPVTACETAELRPRPLDIPIVSKPGELLALVPIPTVGLQLARSAPGGICVAYKSDLASLRRDKVFTHVFSEIGFPFLRADLGELIAGVTDKNRKDVSQVRFLVKARPDRQSALIAALVGFVRQIDIPPKVQTLLAGAPQVRMAFRTKKDWLTAIKLPPDPRYATYTTGDYTIWEETSLWPLAYGPFLQQLIQLMRMYEALLIERRKNGIPTLDQTSRVFPTRMHYAFASLGAWLGGTDNLQFFAYHATRLQIANNDINVSYGVRIGYEQSEAEELTASGMAVIPATEAWPLMEAQGEPTSEIPLFGGIPLDEWNLVNWPAKREIADRTRHAGLLHDKYYRATFWARPLEKQALFGANSVLRDHYADFYCALGERELLRCKHYCAPIIDVDSVDDIRRYVSQIPIRDKDGVFFRGQGRLHKLDRTERVKGLLFGDSCSDEPSLTTSAARKNIDYDELHFTLRHFIAEYSLESKEALARWKEKSNTPLCEIDYAIMAVAQHYGMPSHGLDVTTDLDVAIWFATNKFSQPPKGLASYRAMTPADWPTDRNAWPVVFVCQRVTHSLSFSLQDCRELKDFGLLAERPHRQKARFFLGGHSDHQNTLAETVVCMFRLAPAVYSTACTFNTLFPSPEEDAAYAVMLKFRDHPDFNAIGGDYIARYHPA